MRGILVCVVLLMSAVLFEIYNRDEIAQRYIQDKKDIYSYTLESKPKQDQDYNTYKKYFLYFDVLSSSNKTVISISSFNDTQQEVELRSFRIQYSDKCREKEGEIKVGRMLARVQFSPEVTIPITCKYIEQIEPILMRDGLVVPKSEIELKFGLKPKYQTSLLSSKDIIVVKNDLELKKSVVIAEDQTLILERGIQIRLTEGAAIVVRGRVLVNGTDDKKVTILGESDCGGLFLDQSKGSRIQGLFVKGCHGGRYDESYYSGSLVILRSENIELNNVSLINSTADDALNINHTDNISIKNLKIINSRDDGLDINSSIGSLANSRFSKCRGDCLDLYRTNLRVENIHIEYAEDKGISIGERSVMRIKGSSVEGSRIGVSIKDGSILKYKNLIYGSNNENLKLSRGSVITNESNQALSYE